MYDCYSNYFGFGKPILRIEIVEKLLLYEMYRKRKEKIQKRKVCSEWNELRLYSNDLNTSQ